MASQWENFINPFTFQPINLNKSVRKYKLLVRNERDKN